jgi:hypothetical protein
MHHATGDFSGVPPQFRGCAKSIAARRSSFGGNPRVSGRAGKRVEPGKDAAVAGAEFGGLTGIQTLAVGEWVAGSSAPEAAPHKAPADAFLYAPFYRSTKPALPAFISRLYNALQLRMVPLFG